MDMLPSREANCKCIYIPTMFFIGKGYYLTEIWHIKMSLFKGYVKRINNLSVFIQGKCRLGKTL